MTFRQKILVVLISANDGSWLDECLNCLLESDFPDFHVIFIDNGSRDRTATIGDKFSSRPNIHVVTLTHRCSFADANNIGFRFAEQNQFEYVFMLNADTRLHPAALRKLYEFMELNANFGVVGPLQTDYDLNDWRTLNEWSKTMTGFPAENVVVNDDLSGRLLPCDYIQGAALFTRVGLFAQIGILDRVFGTFYEETDFCRRVKAKGADIGILTDCIVQHFGGGNWKKNEGVHLERDILFLRNQLIYVWSENAGLKKRFFALARCLFFQVTGLLRGQQGTRIGFTKYFGVVVQFVGALKWCKQIRIRSKKIEAQRPIDKTEYSIGPELERRLLSNRNDK